MNLILKPNFSAHQIDLFLKRPFDALLSSIALVLSSWLWVLITIAIMIEDGEPVIIKQIRVGKKGIKFTSYKFRSMVKSTLREKVNHQASENDLRITRVGKFLRRTALDELPQLINILIGDMSFVGPRALLPQEIEINGNPKCVSIEELPGYKRRITVRPGLTGIAQIFAPRDLPRKHKFKYDLLYIRKMGLIYDLRLILVSFLITFKGKWETRQTKLKNLRKRETEFYHRPFAWFTTDSQVTSKQMGSFLHTE